MAFLREVLLTFKELFWPEEEQAGKPAAFARSTVGAGGSAGLWAGVGFSALGDSDDDGPTRGTLFAEPAWHNGWGAMPDWTMSMESGGTRMNGDDGPDVDAFAGMTDTFDCSACSSGSMSDD